MSGQSKSFLKNMIANGVTVSIVVPVYKGGRPFDFCLESLARLTKKPHEVIIVGDGDGDGSWKNAASFGFKAVCLKAHGGPAKARNFGAEQATGEWLLFLDADVEAHPNLLDVVAESITCHPGADAFIGSYDDEPGETGFLSQYRNLLHHFVHQEAEPTASTFWGACGLIRKSAFDSVNGFDPTTYTAPSIEDIELGYRLRTAGFSIRHQNNLMVKHWKRWDYLNLIKTDIFLRAIPWTKLILQTKGRHDELNISLRYKVGLVFSCLILLAPLVLTYSALAALSITLVCLGMFLSVNIRLFYFFQRKRGTWFTIKTLFWRWIYDLCCGIGFSIGYVGYFWEKLCKAKALGNDNRS